MEIWARLRPLNFFLAFSDIKDLKKNQKMPKKNSKAIAEPKAPFVEISFFFFFALCGLF